MQVTLARQCLYAEKNCACFTNTARLGKTARNKPSTKQCWQKKLLHFGKTWLLHWLATFCKNTLLTQVCSLDTDSVKEQKTEAAEECCPSKEVQCRTLGSLDWFHLFIYIYRFIYRFVCMCIHRNTHTTAKGTHNCDATNCSLELEKNSRWISNLLSTVMAASLAASSGFIHYTNGFKYLA